MSGWLGLTVALACGYGTLKLLPVFIVASQLLRLRVRAPELVVMRRDEIPELDRDVLDAARAELTAAGFCYGHTYRNVPMLDAGRPSFCDVYRHVELPAVAVVGSAAAAGGMPYNLSFETHFADGTSLLTVNRILHLCLPFPSQASIGDADADAVDAMWAFHRERLATSAANGLDDPEQIAAHAFALLRATYQYWIEKGWVAHAGNPNRARLTIDAALWLAWRAVRSARKAAAPFRSEAAASASSQAASARIAFEQQLALKDAKPTSPFSRLALLLVSAALAGVAFGVALSWEIVPVLLAVLALHEFGHYLAMRVVGYRDVGVFFLPFLGAATAGRKDDATPMQQLFVYLAGPVPGLVLGLACLLYAYGTGSDHAGSELVRQFGWMSVILNFLNLLPISPLDGGRIVEVFLLGRFPRARVGFVMAGALAFAALAVASFDAGYLDYAALAIAVLLMLALPFHWRTAQVLAQAQRRVEMPAQREEALQVLFETLAQPPLQARPLGERVAIAKAALPALLVRHPGPTGAIFGLAIYAFCAVAPVMGAGYYWLNYTVAARGDHLAASDFTAETAGTQSVERLRKAAEQRLEEDLAAVADVGERWELIYDAGLESAEYDPEGAKRLFARAMEIAATFPPDDLRSARTKLQLALHAPPQQQVAALESIVIATKHGSNQARVVGAEALEAIADLAGDRANVRIERLRAALGIREEVEPPGSLDLINQREALARLLDETGESQEAEELLRKSVRETGDPTNAPGRQACTAGRAAESRCGATRPLAWFLIAHERAGESTPLLHEALQHERPGYPRLQCLTTLGWAQLQAGDAKAALVTFEDARELQQRRSEAGSWWQRAVAGILSGEAPQDPSLLLDGYLAARAAGDRAATERWRRDLGRAVHDAARLSAAWAEASKHDRWEGRRYEQHANALASPDISQSRPQP